MSEINESLSIKEQTTIERMQMEVLKHMLMQKGIKIEEDRKSDNLIKVINFADYEGLKVAEREWIIRDWLPRGHVSGLCGEFGVGKTTLLQQLAIAVATGKPFLGNKLTTGRVYIVTPQDIDVWIRQTELIKNYGAGTKDINIKFLLRTGGDSTLMTFEKDNSMGNLTMFYDRLYIDILKYNPDLVILDSADDFFDADETNHCRVRRFIQMACGKIAKDTNAAVLLCIHDFMSNNPEHNSKWNNTLRSSWYLRQRKAGIDDCRYVLTRVKSNFAKPGAELNLHKFNGVFTLANFGTEEPTVTEETAKKRRSHEYYR